MIFLAALLGLRFMHFPLHDKMLFEEVCLDMLEECAAKSHSLLDRLRGRRVRLIGFTNNETSLNAARKKLALYDWVFSGNSNKWPLRNTRTNGQRRGFL